MLNENSIDRGLQTEPGKEIMFEKHIDKPTLLNQLKQRFDLA